jgi:Galactose oxidase, central domain/Kelch motif
MKCATRSLSNVPLFLASVLLVACSGVPHSSSSNGGSGGSTTVTIGGTVTGLTGSGLVLQDNGGDNLSVTASGSFTFKTALKSGSAYAVTVLTQPSSPSQNCAVTGGTGTATANVTNVAVACTTAAVSATISGAVSGLSGTGLVLQNNGGDSLTITGNGAFTFKTPVTGTGAYAVTVLTQPVTPNQICTVANGSGTATANVTGVTVTCVLAYTIGGTVNGLVGTGMVLADNGTDQLTITSSNASAFTFKKLVPTGSNYAVAIVTQPSTPSQTCTIVAGTGSGTATANVTNVTINCPAVTFSVGGNVVGLVGKQPTPPNNQPLTDNSFQLLNNGGDNKIITQNGPFQFATPVALNGAYSISELHPPSTQPQGCTIWGYLGVATANVTNVLVDCAHDDWTWINGTKTAGIDGTPQYGSFPATPPTVTPNPYTNTPGAREGGAAWTDSSGNLWLFGGFGFELSGSATPATISGYLNDLWVCPMTGDYCQWQLLETPDINKKFPIAQSENNVTSGSLPGGRSGSATWTDASGPGHLWLFGGQGIDSAGSFGLVGDLWQYTIGGGWTHVSGSTLRDQKGNYTGAPGSLFPGARWSPASWTDKSGNFWLFGGFGYDANGNLGFLNDLWEYTGGNWVFVSAPVPGSSLINQNGVYGTKGTAAAGNTPGGRQTAATWVDAAGNLWLFGGEGEDATGTANGILNDLWVYNVTSNQWTFVLGSTAANQDGVYSAQPLIGPAATTTAAGTVGLTGATPGIFPGSRWGAAAWTDAAGNLWLLGGWGLDSTGTNGNGYLNDLWVYTPNATLGQPGTWTWVKGSNTGNQNGIYGPETRPYLTNVNWTPGARRGAMRWVDGLGELWLFGGQGYDSTSTNGNGFLSDQWRYLPYP